MPTLTTLRKAVLISLYGSAALGVFGPAPHPPWRKPAMPPASRHGRRANGQRGRLAPRHRQFRHRHHGAGRYHSHDQGRRTGRPVRPGAVAAIYFAVVQLDPPDRRRRRRPGRFGRPARPRFGPDAGAGQRQAPPHDRAGQPVRRAQPRQHRHRHECDSAAGDQERAGAARRRRRPVRLGRDRRRDRYRTEEKPGLRGGGRLQPVFGRRRQELHELGLLRHGARRQGRACHHRRIPRPRPLEPRRRRQPAHHRRHQVAKTRPCT